MATSISWTEETWNVCTGCTKVSAGCANCYAKREAPRMKASHPVRYRNGFDLTLQPKDLDKPRHWRKPRLVFVCSMSDLFHEDVPDAYLHQVFDVMEECSQHTFQVLTKRPERMLSFSESISWPANVWAGTTIERNDYVSRADTLRQVPSAVRFISAEPLLGPLPDLDLTSIDQLIVGGESGRGWRPMEADWVRDLRDRCVTESVGFHFKQWAGLHPKKLGRDLDGRTWDEMPAR